MNEIDKSTLAEMSPEQIVQTISLCVQELQRRGRYDLITQAIGSSAVEHIRLEAARSSLSRLVITRDYRFLLVDYGKEIMLSPIHKAVYLLFLAHPEGIEFKQLVDYREELYDLYLRMCNRMDLDKIEETIDHLVNPLDNAINEKCSRIKKAFTDVLDEYVASFYVISGHSRLDVPGDTKLWFRRKKVITLPRSLVCYESKR